MNEKIIEIKNLSFSYNGTPVLDDVNLDVFAGDFMALIGPNGGGKTTLVKMMLGLLTPDRGEILLWGKKPYQVVHRIGYAPQDLHANNSFPISVFDVTIMGAMKGGRGLKRFSRAEKEKARESLERVEMWDYRNKRIQDLSGGQRQRVFIARALVGDPDLLLLDEPTSSVDQKGQKQLFNFLKELNKNATIIVVSHDLMALSTYIQSVACVSRKVHFHNAPVITKDMLETAYQCPVDLIAHGLPHRVFHEHNEE